MKNYNKNKIKHKDNLIFLKPEMGCFQNKLTTCMNSLKQTVWHYTSHTSTSLVRFSKKVSSSTVSLLSSVYLTL